LRQSPFPPRSRHRLRPRLDGRENIFLTEEDLNGAILGMTRREIDRKFDEIAAFAEVEKLIDTPAKRYSSGMYVRLAFAVVGHLEPEAALRRERPSKGKEQVLALG
jgi:lipopolysaccharide transport system ATP-binding protein